MGAGTIIATAIAIMLLIITGYVLISGTLSTARVVVMAQKDTADRENQKMHTRIEILNASANTVACQTFINVMNTGTEVIGDFQHMDVYLLQAGVPRTYMNGPGTWNWTCSITQDQVNPTLLDPDEYANITVNYDWSGGDPTWVKVTTANGVYASANLPKV